MGLKPSGSISSASSVLLEHCLVMGEISSASATEPNFQSYRILLSAVTWQLCNSGIARRVNRIDPSPKAILNRDCIVYMKENGRATCYIWIMMAAASIKKHFGREQFWAEMLNPFQCMLHFSSKSSPRLCCFFSHQVPNMCLHFANRHQEPHRSGQAPMEEVMSVSEGKQEVSEGLSISSHCFSILDYQYQASQQPLLSPLLKQQTSWFGAHICM